MSEKMRKSGKNPEILEISVEIPSPRSLKALSFRLHVSLVIIIELILPWILKFWKSGSKKDGELSFVFVLAPKAPIWT